MKTMKKNLSFVLAILTVLALLAACSDEVTPSAGTTAAPDPGSKAPEATTAPAETVQLDEYGREVVPDELPEANLGGRQFVVHTRGNVQQYEWYAPEMNGQTLNDAIYRRNTNVENRYGINLVIIAEGTWADYNNTTLPKMKASIASGNGAYDLIAGYSTPISSMVTTGLLCDLNDFDYIHLDKPWWNQSIREELSIDDRTYFGVGSLSTSMIYSMMCIFVNTDILEEAAEEGYNIYKTVNDGKWTFDELLRLSSRAYIDVNSNTKVDAEDRIGFATTDTSNTNSTIGFYYATGLKLTDRDENGNIILNVDVEKTTEVVEKIRTLLYTGEGVLPTTENPNFADGNILFYFHWLYGGQTKYAGAMDHYGIVPVPKYDESQSRYYTAVQSGMHMYCIPVDVENPQDVGLVTEALAAESYRVLQPAYYEVVLKSRYAKDAWTSMMVDLMYNTVVFDFANTYNGSIGLVNTIKTVVGNPASSFASAYATSKNVAQKKLDELIVNARAAVK